MRCTTQQIQRWICSIIIAASPLPGAVKLQVRQGCPIVDGVYVNGHGPYRFLVDTGANVNLIDANLAQSIGLSVSSQTNVTSVSQNTSVPLSKGNQVVLDSIKAEEQEFLFSQLESIHDLSPDVQGLLGQSFLSRFDYVLDLRGKTIAFGKQERNGTRLPFWVSNGRPTVSTSLGDLILDSGANHLVLFGVDPEAGSGARNEMRTVAGSRLIGMVSSKALIIDGRRLWHGNAVAIPNRAEQGVNGLMPLNLFKTVYVCNSDGYLVFE
jgi:hypothetical protein